MRERYLGGYYYFLFGSLVEVVVGDVVGGDRFGVRMEDLGLR